MITSYRHLKWQKSITTQIIFPGRGTHGEGGRGTFWERKNFPRVRILEENCHKRRFSEGSIPRGWVSAGGFSYMEIFFIFGGNFRWGFRLRGTLPPMLNMNTHIYVTFKHGISFICNTHTSNWFPIFHWSTSNLCKLHLMKHAT